MTWWSSMWPKTLNWCCGGKKLQNSVWLFLMCCVILCCDFLFSLQNWDCSGKAADQLDVHLPLHVPQGQSTQKKRFCSRFLQMWQKYLDITHHCLLTFKRWIRPGLRSTSAKPRRGLGWFGAGRRKSSQQVLSRCRNVRRKHSCYQSKRRLLGAIEQIFSSVYILCVLHKTG